MAIQYNATAFGTTFPTAYGKISSLQYDGFSEVASATLTTWVSAAARQSSLQAITSSSVAFTVDLTSTQNIIQQAYAAIKARPEFTGATDV